MVLKAKPALQYSQGRSKPWSGAQLINCFAEKSDGDQRDMFAVMASPGLSLFANLGASPARGSHVMGALLYVVMGTTLYSVTSAGVATGLGFISGTDRVRMADNGTELAIAADGLPYVWDGSAISIQGVGAVEDVFFSDGYIGWILADSKRWVISALNDALTYDPVDIASVEGEPSNILGVINDHREIQFYKQRSIEIWYNSGAADFPFERQGNAFIERGCFDRDSIVKIDNSVHFLGDDRIVYRLDGYNPLRISTHAVEYEIRSASYARGFTYTQEGHKFYCLWTSAGTFCYDMATGAWHKRKSTSLDYWRVGGASAAFNQTILTDGTTGKLYTPSLDVYSENGVTISMEILLPTIESPDRREITMYAFELNCETGVGLTSGQGSDPQAMLTYSDDGGRTWSNELWRSMGAVGTYRTRAIWRKLGQFRQRQIKLTITDPVRRLVMGYWMDAR